MRIPHLPSICALLALTCACCSPHDDHAPAPDTVASDTLAPATLGTIEHVHAQGDVFLASQPAADDFRAAQAGGVRTVIDLRKPGEVTELDEPALARELGLAYRNFPFKSPEELTDEVLDGVRAVLVDPAARPILMHCSSGNRVGAVWLAHRVLDGGLAWDAALAEAREVGLTSQALEQRARAYVDARR